MWDDDDQGRHPTETGERDFEIEYTGMTASMRGSISVDVHMPSPRLNTWDLRTETSANSILPPDDRFGLVVSFSAEGNIEKKIQDIIDYAIASKECTKAFEAAGATPIKDQLIPFSVRN